MIGPGRQHNPLSALAELKQRLLFVLWGLIVFRIGSHIPVPGIDAARLAEIFQNNQNNIMGMANVLSGGALQRLSIFALGIMPYITTSIVMQLLTMVVPHFEQLKKEGELGRRKITQYTRYGTLVLATFHAIGMSRFLASSGTAIHGGFLFYLTTVVTLVTGTLFLMWLGEKITERGIGNGISLIIFAGIAAGLPRAIAGTFDQVRQGLMQPIALIFLVMILLGITAFVVFIERAQRRITVNYAKRQQGRKIYAAQQSHLPLKINMAGVIPPIFASSLILLPASLTQWFGQSKSSFVSEIGFALQPGQPLYILMFSAFIIFFSFVYTAMMFNPRETADNLKRSGAFIPGIRPGDQTASYIDKVMTRLTLVGAAYITAVAILPEFLVLGWQVPFYFGGTSLLIIVVVIMDFIAQIQAHLMSQQYESLLKKANSKGREGGPGSFGLLR